MVSSIAISRARRNRAIVSRYDIQELLRVGGKSENVRKEWTPAQRRRMKKHIRTL